MQFQKMWGGVREFCADAPESIITTSAIAFLVANRLDFYGAQLVNAGKGAVVYSTELVMNSREETFTEKFAFGQAGHARRLVNHSCDSEWEMIDIVDNISNFTEMENRGMRAMFFYDGKVKLTWKPSCQEKFEIWGEKILFKNLQPSKEVSDIPALFHHLIIESASIPALNKLLLKPKEYGAFVGGQKQDLKESVARREIIWRNYLAPNPDHSRTKDREEYSPLRDSFYD